MVTAAVMLASGATGVLPRQPTRMDAQCRKKRFEAWVGSIEVEID
jgi:hypothetical protein